MKPAREPKATDDGIALVEHLRGVTDTALPSEQTRCSSRSAAPLATV